MKISQPRAGAKRGKGRFQKKAIVFLLLFFYKASSVLKNKQMLNKITKKGNLKETISTTSPERKQREKERLETKVTETRCYPRFCNKASEKDSSLFKQKRNRYTRVCVCITGLSVSCHLAGSNQNDPGQKESQSHSRLPSSARLLASWILGSLSSSDSLMSSLRLLWYL